MRKEFSICIERIAREDQRIIFLTGDLGFMALENVRDALGSRFMNVGVSEQNMISVAAGLANEGLIPVCYSIAPFAVFRPAEQIRIDICLHNMNVKIVGNGGGYGYGIMGATHHALEDIAVLSSFQNMNCFIPFCNEDVENNVHAMLEYGGPSYLRLGFGKKGDKTIVPAFEPFRKITEGNKITVAALGPVTLNLCNAIDKYGLQNDVELFTISRIPFTGLNKEFLESIKKTKRLLICEEHVRRGGLGEHLGIFLLTANVRCAVKHHFASGYPNGLYGSQEYHQKINNLDMNSIANSIINFINE